MDKVGTVEKGEEVIVHDIRGLTLKIMPVD